MSQKADVLHENLCQCVVFFKKKYFFPYVEKLVGSVSFWMSWSRFRKVHPFTESHLDYRLPCPLPHTCHRFAKEGGGEADNEITLSLSVKPAPRHSSSELRIIAT